MHPKLTVVDHPLIQDKLARLRDACTPPPVFSSLVREMSALMAFEVTRDLGVEDLEVETPLERCGGKRLAGAGPVLVPILRAGLGMVDGMHQVLPGAPVGHIGMYRNEETLEPVRYYFRVPNPADGRAFILLDPMLATGGSAVESVGLLENAGARDIRLVCLIAAPEGVAKMLEHHPGVPIYTAAVDRRLNDKGYILPGLGDAGDRIFGTL